METNYNKLRICDIEYNIKPIYKNNKKLIKTKCKIRYHNPLLREIKESIGVSTYCQDENHPYDISIGKHIAESRAKHNMYDTYVTFVQKTLTGVILKHHILKNKEKEHINDIINNL
jgi:hypothetical protein